MSDCVFWTRQAQDVQNIDINICCLAWLGYRIPSLPLHVEAFVSIFHCDLPPLEVEYFIVNLFTTAQGLSGVFNNN